MLVLGALMIALGFLGPLARVQWQRHRWLGSARWLVAHGSVHLVRAAPVAGLTVSSIGATLIWSAAIVLTMVMALAFLAVLFTSTRRGGPALGSRTRV